jgi:hypothetical protein
MGNDARALEAEETWNPGGFRTGTTPLLQHEYSGSRRFFPEVGPQKGFSRKGEGAADDDKNQTKNLPI